MNKTEYSKFQTQDHLVLAATSITDLFNETKHIVSIGSNKYFIPKTDHLDQSRSLLVESLKAYTKYAYNTILYIRIKLSNNYDHKHLHELDRLLKVCRSIQKDIQRLLEERSIESYTLLSSYIMDRLYKLVSDLRTFQKHSPSVRVLSRSKIPLSFIFKTALNVQISPIV
jgi:hypothetical protein